MSSECSDLTTVFELVWHVPTLFPVVDSFIEVDLSSWDSLWYALNEMHGEKQKVFRMQIEGAT